MDGLDITARANALLQAGRSADACTMLDRACAAGDADALYVTAIWLLAGLGWPRDLGRARAVLGQSVAAGHIDACLLETALMANGTGGSVDWAGAVALLRRIARTAPVARQQLALLDAMTLDDVGHPRAVAPPARLSTAPNVWHFPTLLTPGECGFIAQTAADLLEPAMVFDPASGRMISHPIRTSDGAVIGPGREFLPIRAINHRIAAASGTQIDQGEPLTVLRYTPGQQYRPHVDTIAGEPNQRVRTLIIYLNHGHTGGETIFTHCGLRVAPRGGDAILFDNVDAMGRPDHKSQHAGLPVTQGAKWIATRWIRARPHDPWATR